MTSLQSWYDSLSPLRVDLVGDFAGKDLFAIHGDALMLYCIAQAQVDLTDGFQILHAVHAVEAFLENLRQRGCNFHIVWFEDHARLCVPNESTEEVADKYFLTRDVIHRHLERPTDGAFASDEAQHSPICFQFSSLLDSRFEAYLVENALHFFLCLNPITMPSCSESASLFYLSVARHLSSKGYSLAFINTIEFVSSKVQCSVASPSSSLTTERSVLLTALYGATEKHSSLDVDSFRKSIHGWSPWDGETKLTAREAIALFAICEMAKAHEEDLTEFAHLAWFYIVHLILLRRLPLSQRSFEEILVDDEDMILDFLSEFSKYCIMGLKLLAQDFEWDMFDLLDGRLLKSIVARPPQLPLTLVEEAHKFAEKIKQITGIDIYPSSPSFEIDNNLDKPASTANSVSVLSTSVHRYGVLPFSQPALDTYLQNVQLVPAISSQQGSVPRIFRELSHWHNARTLVDPKRPPRQRTFWEHRSMQRWMAVYIRYSASLTNSSGKNIDPEHVVVDVGNTNGSSNRNAKAGIKKINPMSGRQSALDSAQALRQKKTDMKSKDILASWTSQCLLFEKETDLKKRYLKIARYINSLTGNVRSTVEAEALVYSCNTLISMLESTGSSTRPRMEISSLVWSILQDLQHEVLSQPSAKLLNTFAKALQFPAAWTVNKHITTPLPYRTLLHQQDVTSNLEPASVEFQLEHCGPFLERSFDPAPDPRVPFHPDAWQRKVLDAIDEEKSLFVVAPTSAGKTFISFYAMKRVLKGNDDGVLVYVAPTKALVNQIAAEIQARFTKSYKHDGRSVWAIHTRDYRINNPTGCQVLVTVPHMLQIMLMAPSNADSQNSWSRRVKRIIFDEVHCIGQADDGVIWEQLLLLAPCPIIALSATVGNPLDFKAWLEGSERAKGNKLEMITHSARYSDLRKFFWKPDPSFVFTGARPVERLPIPGLDSGVATTTTSHFSYIHPVASLINRNRGTIQDISLEPRDCLMLWKAMMKYQSDDFPVDPSLDPATALPKIVKKADVAAYEERLKAAFQVWMNDRESPFEAVRDELRKEFPMQRIHYQNLKHMALSLVTDLHNMGALPAILFNYDRMQCEDIAFSMLDKLSRAEEAWKAASPEWERKIAAFSKWKKDQPRIQAMAEKANKAKAKSKIRKGEDNAEYDKIEEDPSPLASFDPKAPLSMFSLADETKLSTSEFEETVKPLLYRGMNPKFVDALRRGIGVHHAGMSHKYRQVVEILFRKGFLRVVTATGTLALGLNMPCKTVVFFGDSVFLTALNYHQAAGRAGRRGFDLLGNVVFAGMTQERVYEIMSSRLPDLRGHFPLSTTLVLRTLGLLHHTKNCDYSTRAVRSLLSQTRLYLGGPADQMSIKHHLRFSIEYLRRQHLLSANGSPLNFSGLVGHMYFTENAVFAFHSLLKEGYFHDLCNEYKYASEATLLKLVLVLSHIFCRISTSGVKFDLEVVHRSPSVVFLPPLPDDALRVLREHNRDTLQIFTNYAETFVDQHLADKPDRILPFTKYKVGARDGDSKTVDAGQVQAAGNLPPTKLRSPFAALSGFRDNDFVSIHDLCTTVRGGVFLEESAIPYIPLHPDDTGEFAWNAYIYDFFKHGDMKALVRDNRIKRGDVWFHLKDFSLVLATLVTSLNNFINLESGDDEDLAMMDVQAAEDALQEGEEDGFDDLANGRCGEQNSMAAQEHPKKAEQRLKKPKKAAVAESWDDEEDIDSEDGYSHSDSGEESSMPSTPPAWDGEGGNKLPQVLEMFLALRAQFDDKFLKVWA